MLVEFGVALELGGGDAADASLIWGSGSRKATSIDRLSGPSLASTLTRCGTSNMMASDGLEQQPHSGQTASRVTG